MRMPFASQAPLVQVVIEILAYTIRECRCGRDPSHVIYPCMDVTRELGYLTLGTRFRRIGERLQAQTQTILDAHGLTVPAAQFPFLAALDRLGPLAIGELAEAVGVTQPAATRVAAQLAEAELVTITASEEDQRRRTVELSRQGKRLVAAAKRTAWRVV